MNKNQIESNNLITTALDSINNEAQKEYLIISKTGSIIYRSIHYDLLNKVWQEKYKDKLGYKFVAIIAEKLDPDNIGIFLSEEMLQNKEQKAKEKKEDYIKIKNLSNIKKVDQRTILTELFDG